MAEKFYPINGEGDKLSPKLQKVSKESTTGRKQIHIPELRMTVFTKLHETPQQTRERYLKNRFKV